MTAAAPRGAGGGATTPPPGGTPRTTRYETEVTEVGPQVEEFVRAGMLVFFRNDAPEELRPFSVLHQPAVADGGLTPGDVMTIGDRQLVITAVGEVADRNLVELGHITLKANGAEEAPLPGDVCVERAELPEVGAGARVVIRAGTGSTATNQTGNGQ